ncbi:hypothetical protein IV498_03125 [Paenarthrobacter sp. Z7-10]|uniref:TRADD-N-associated membrane domain-containing protein n=1 Tax=Paenarthrobacter sp. Z7-10 TaxID=2787635 RepID=UPI0022A9A688|nr:hypothetical protein [Paenarthrobacter sp. Z7-10]MCZ2402197.1 hypothetical protein [Paenarthrobacter sp. Z7-10]
MDGKPRRSRGQSPGSPDRLRHLQESQNLDTRLISLWSTSAERTWYMGSRERVYIWCGVGLVLVLGGLWSSTADLDRAWGPDKLWGLVAITLGAVVLAWCTVPYWSARRAYASRKRAVATYRVDQAIEELRKVMESGQGNLQLPRLFDLNRRQLDQYQDLTKSQQHVAFVLTWCAAVGAFLVLIAGSILALRVGDEDKFITGGLTALGTILSTFLGKTFFEGHREAMKQLNYYYAEPSLTGRLLAAERILDQLPSESRSEYVAALITRILAPDPVRKGGAKLPERAGKTTGHSSAGPAAPSGHAAGGAAGASAPPATPGL